MYVDELRVMVDARFHQHFGNICISQCYYFMLHYVNGDIEWELQFCIFKDYCDISKVYLKWKLIILSSANCIMLCIGAKAEVKIKKSL